MLKHFFHKKYIVNRRWTTWFCFLIILNFIGCNTGKTTRVNFHIKYGYNKKFLLQTVPFKSEKTATLDSGVSKKDYDSLVFYISSAEEKLFRIYAEEVNMNIEFINDSPVIDIYANYAKADSYSFSHSNASTALRNFSNSQDSLAAITRQLPGVADSIGNHNSNNPLTGPVDTILKNRLHFFYDQYKNFEDTVTSPAAFMAMYNNVDFGNDFTGLKKFIENAGKRFPGYAPIQRLKNETLAYLKIFEEEYNVGDLLPPISLTDNNNKSFSTASLKGKYYLLDFWATWCNSCILYFPEKEKASKMFSTNQFEIVSVAIDNEKENWLNILHHSNLNWHQLIDTAMWQGETIKQLKFDSIPFNFLVSPEGKVLQKAIKKDSLVFYVSKYLGNQKLSTQ